MTVAPARTDLDTGAGDGPAEAATGGTDRLRGLARRLAAPVGLAALIVVMAQIPLLSNRAFYFWDDSAAQFIPTWRFIGEQLRAGEFPLLSPELWTGGNLAAEALFGLFNPLCLLTAVFVSLIPNLAIAAALVKTGFLVVLGLGGYGLAREYGASRWPAVAAGAVLPFAGFTLYFDAASWVSGLIATSLVPHLWWTTRRSARGGLSPIVPFVVGYLTITTGNPYGLLGAILVFGVLLVEFGLARRWPEVKATLLSGVATGLCVPLVFLPLLLNSHVTVRAGAGVANDGFMVPGIGDVLNLSTPTFLPFFISFGGSALTVPVTYLAWWVLPLVPWLRWRELIAGARDRAGLFVFGAIALVLCVGPAYVWMFRWPARMLPFCGLAIIVVTAIALSGGVRRDRWRLRAVLSGVIIALGGYLAFAARPDLTRAHVIGVVLVAGACAAAVWLGIRRPRVMAPFLVATGVVVLLAQTAWAPSNRNVVQYYFPTSVAQLRADFADRYPGTVLQVANGPATAAQGRPEVNWHHLLFGSMLHTAGVHSINTYTGMNYVPFAEPMCLVYEGSVCPDVLNRLWRPRTDGLPPVADLVKLETLVVQNDLEGLRPFPVPDGWRLAERNEVVSVYRREAPVPFAGSRLAVVSGNLDVAPVASENQHETVRVDGGGTLTFARLDWPGYSATLGDVELPVRHTAEGLLQVDVPPGSRGDLTVRWSPPGLPLGLISIAAAVLVAILHTVLHIRRRKAKRA